MARRASSRPNPLIILGAAAAIIALVFIGKSFLGRKTAAFADAAPLRIEELLENGNSLRGSEYAIEGFVEEKLQWTPDRGQVVSIRVETPSGDEYMGIKIPNEFSSLNIDTRQKYAFKVKFEQGGIAVATGIDRL